MINGNLYAQPDTNNLDFQEAIHMCISYYWIFIQSCFDLIDQIIHIGNKLRHLGVPVIKWSSLY